LKPLIRQLQGVLSFRLKDTEEEKYWSMFAIIALILYWGV